MRKALVLTIGTEITCGEVVNTNAAWVSERLEEFGLRVFSHLTVRDQVGEIQRALLWSESYDVVVVTGGLGPTSDDITRQCLAEFSGQPLEFDEDIWLGLKAMYLERQLPLREAHRHQCWFPKGSERLLNPVGSALGFFLEHKGKPYFVLPGPPRELEGMWHQEVHPRLARHPSAEMRQWIRWVCIGAPESEIAELVEKVIAGHDLEVGYRAQIPYVKVKVFAQPVLDHAVIAELDLVLAPFVVGRGQEDLADLLLARWPLPVLSLQDSVTGLVLVSRLIEAYKARRAKSLPTPELRFESTLGEGADAVANLILSSKHDEFTTRLNWNHQHAEEVRTLPYKVKLDSERGRRSAAEWALWHCVRALSSQALTTS